MISNKAGSTSKLLCDLVMETIHLPLEEKKDRGPALLLIIIYTWRIEICTFTRAGGSSVIRPKLSYVPRPTGLFLRLTCIFVLPNVNKVEVGATRS